MPISRRRSSRIAHSGVLPCRNGATASENVNFLGCRGAPPGGPSPNRSPQRDPCGPPGGTPCKGRKEVLESSLERGEAGQEGLARGGGGGSAAFAFHSRCPGRGRRDLPCPGWRRRERRRSAAARAAAKHRGFRAAQPGTLAAAVPALALCGDGQRTGDIGHGASLWPGTGSQRRTGGWLSTRVATRAGRKACPPGTRDAAATSVSAGRRRRCRARERGDGQDRRPRCQEQHGVRPVPH